MLFASYSALFATLLATSASVLAAPTGEAGILEPRGGNIGRGTWYDVGLGACGKTNYNSQPIIAVNHIQYNRKLCGKWITVKNAKNGKTARGYVEDMCPGCKKWDLDLSPSVFKKMAPLGQGVIQVSWAAPKRKRSEILDSEPVVSEDGYTFDPQDELTLEDLDDNDDDEFK